MTRRRAYAILAIMLLMVFWGFDFIEEVVFLPWSNDRFGRTVLLGTWVGQPASDGAGPRAILLDLQLHRSEASGPCIRCQNLEGTIRVCDLRGALFQYPIDGRVEDRHAKRITISFRPGAAPAPGEFEIGLLRGGWDGAHSLLLESKLYYERGPSDSMDVERSAQLSMHRGSTSDFEVACGHDG